jgi:peptide/nickel transport system permease protein
METAAAQPARPADAAAEAVAPTPPAGQWRLAWRRLRRDKVGMAALLATIAILLMVFVGAHVASYLLGHGPNEQFPYAVDVNAKPVDPWTRVPDLNVATQTGEYEIDKPPPGTPDTLMVLGADGPLGRDEFLRVLYGGQTSLEVALLASFFALLLGTTLGMLAGFFGGWMDGIVSRFVDIVMTFPLLLFLLMLGTTVTPNLDHVTLGVFHEGVVSLVVLIAIFTWFYAARIVRTEVITLRDAEFVEAAHMVGASNRWIIMKHLFPHVAPPLAAYGAVLVATNILLEASMSFLNVGIALPTASWGNMLTATWGSLLSQVRYTSSTFQPWLTIIPSLAIFVTVLAFNLLGDSLRAALDPQNA